MLGKGYGMPSSHAQFVTFFSVSLALFLLLRHSPRPSDSHSPTTKAQRMLLSAGAVIYASVVSVSRIYLNYHTVSQVLVGCTSGAASAVVWFALTSWVRRKGYIDYLLKRKEVEMLRFKDLVVEEDLAEAGWERWIRTRARRDGERSNSEKSEKRL